MPPRKVKAADKKDEEPSVEGEKVEEGKKEEKVSIPANTSNAKVTKAKDKAPAKGKKGKAAAGKKDGEEEEEEKKGEGEDRMDEDKDEKDGEKKEEEKKEEEKKEEKKEDKEDKKDKEDKEEEKEKGKGRTRGAGKGKEEPKETEKERKEREKKEKEEAKEKAKKEKEEKAKKAKEEKQKAKEAKEKEKEQEKGDAKAPSRPSRNLLAIPLRESHVGQVFGVGSNPTGELGVHPDEVQQKLKPFPIKALDGVKIVDVACGGMHTMALTEDGKLYSWGNNDEKALGRTGPEYEPRPVEGLDGIKIVQVVCSDSASFCLSDAGKVYGCGTFRDDNGVMGFSEGVRNQATMIEVKTLKGFKVVEIRCSPNSCIALTNDGLVYSFGCGRQEAGSEKDGNLQSVNLLGRGSARSLRGRARTLNAAALDFGPRRSVGKIVKIESGAYHSFAISEHGQVFGWGLNNFGQTGIGHQKNLDQPTPIEKLTELEAVDLAAGALHTVALTKKGELYSFGQGLDGQLGIGKEPEVVLEPTKIEGFGEENPVTKVSCGPQYSAAITKDGKMYTWGSNICGQLATGEEDNELSPFHVKTKNRVVYKVSCGGQFIMILASEPREEDN